MKEMDVPHDPHVLFELEAAFVRYLHENGLSRQKFLPRGFIAYIDVTPSGERVYKFRPRSEDIVV